MALAPLDRIRLDKAAVDEGFGLRRDSGLADWLAYDSLGAPATLRLTRAAEGFVVAVDHPGVAAELSTRWPPWSAAPAPDGFTAFVVPDTAPLHDLVRDVWRLARALPTAPLRVFRDRVAGMPRATEAERLTVQRIGQDVFRAALLDHWAGACAVTSLTDARLLRASHIRPWAACDSDAERLDVHNGLLLVVHLDAAFDAGLLSFDDAGAVLLSPAFAAADRAILGVHAGLRLRRLAPAHRPRLAWHRAHVFQSAA